MKCINGYAMIMTSILIYLLGLSCTDLKKDPELREIRSFELKEVQDSFVFAEVTVEVFNPNKISAKVKSIDADILIDGKKIGKIKDTNTHQFKKNTTSIITLDTSLDLPVFSTLFDQIMNQDSTIIQIKGKAKVSLGIAALKMKMEDQVTISAKQELKKVLNDKLSNNAIKLKGINIGKISFPTSKMEVKVAFRNDLAIDYIVEQVHFDLAFQNEKKSFGKGKIVNPINIKSNSTKTMKAKISITNQEALRQLTRIFTGKKIYAKGTAEVNIAGFRFKIPIQQPILKI